MPDVTSPRLFSFAVRPSDGKVFAVEPQNTSIPRNSLYEVDPDSGALIRLGGPPDKLYLSITFHPLTDQLFANTFETFPPIGIDDYTPGGLAVIPLPEPDSLISNAIGGLLVAGLARRRRSEKTLV